MKEFQAVTYKSNELFKSLKTECHLCKPFDLSIGDKTPETKKYTAIWNPGAANTLITQNVVKELALESTGVINTTSVQGVSVAIKTYLVNIYLTHKMIFKEVTVFESAIEGSAAILIGMDLIKYGDFSITNVNGKSCFSFRIPSIKEVDFVKEGNALKKSKPKYIASKGYKVGRKGKG